MSVPAPLARTPEEEQVVQDFLEPFFGSGFVPGTVVTAERRDVETVVADVANQFGGMKYILGLGLDFTLLAQRMSMHDPAAKAYRPTLTRDALFASYPRITQRGERQANTLTIQYEDPSRQVKVKEGIRKIEEGVVDLFNDLNRTGYPSAYVYNTGQWHKYQDNLLVPCFRLSESGRYLLCQRLIDLGLTLPANEFFGRAIPRVRLFPEIVSHYPRTGAGEVAGVVFQAIAYGYIKADRPHLSLIVDKVRTGSARQRRFGDIDGYFGIDLELSVEVKDGPITLDDLSGELGGFIKKVTVHRVRALAFVETIDKKAAAQLATTPVLPFTQADVLKTVETWDWPKQDAAVQGMLHYLSHVEKDPDAVNRLLTFIAERDRDHDSLAYRQTPPPAAATATPVRSRGRSQP